MRGDKPSSRAESACLSFDLGVEGSLTKISEYRSDIDGLRAVAVIPVVLYHAGFSAISGGYVGVDVFFVISGYLITQIIASEIEQDIFSTTSFYDRRIRRIIPALLVVIAFSIVVGFWIMTPNDFKKLGSSVVATVLFVSNIYFWREANYFEPKGNEEPLLHTWSLSIEEQFYLGYPLLLLGLAKIKRARISILCILCVISFLTSVVLVYFKQSATFYLGPTRAWELFFGGLISLAGQRYCLKSEWRAVIACFGLSLIVIPIFTYTPLTRFPGLSAAPPVLGSGLLIWTGMQCPTFVHSLLSKAPFTAIGKVSYSLYLWHLPMIVFAMYATGEKLSPLVATLICLASLAASFASLRFVERPFRFPKGDKWNYTSSALLAGALAGVLGCFIMLSGGLPRRLDQAALRLLDAENDKEKYHTECLSLDRQIVPPNQACHLGAPNTKPTVLLWGDSHAMVTAEALEQVAAKRNTSFLFAASVDCPIGLGFSIDPTKGPGFAATPGYQYCGQYNAKMLELALNNPDIATIVLSSRWTNWRLGEPGAPSEGDVDIRLRDKEGTALSREDNKRIFRNGFERLIPLLVNSGKAIWIVGPIPEPSSRIPKALYIHHLGFDKRIDLDILRSSFDEKNRWIVALFKELSSKYPIKIIWPDTALCTATVCPVSENGRPLFMDDNHLSLAGIRKTIPLYNDVFPTNEPTAIKANQSR